jgi:CRP-like cAMP-binding protein
VSTITPDALKQVSLFDELSADELEVLADSLLRRRYAKGQAVFHQGEAGTSLYLIESGAVKILITTPEGKGLVLRLLGPGDFFGELSLLDGEPRSADAIAQEPCELLLLRREDFLRFLEARPTVAARLLAAVSRRLRYTSRQAQETAFLDVPARLARVLLELVEVRGQPVDAGQQIASFPTQTELAEMVGATRESVNKWLGAYERQGLIRRERGSVLVLKPDELRRRIY